MFDKKNEQKFSYVRISFLKFSFYLLIFLIYIFTSTFLYAQSSGMTQRGIATRQMSNQGLFAAHPSLPLQSRIKITNPANGREIEVTVIERISVSLNRIIDLSPTVWSELRLGTATNASVIVTIMSTPENSNTTAGIEGALERAAREVIKNIQQRSRVAIVYIVATDNSMSDFIAGELEYIWVNNGYTIIDRSQLNFIRREQDYQLSGEVDDDTAVSIGKFAGADFIVTGRVDGEGSLRRLRLRLINTTTAQVIGAASERY